MSLGSQSPIGIPVYHTLIKKMQNSMIESKKME